MAFTSFVGSFSITAVAAMLALDILRPAPAPGPPLQRRAGGALAATAREPVACAATARRDCLQAAKARLRVDDRADDGADRIDWDWKHGEMFTNTDTGDPASSTAYMFCLYDAAQGAEHLDASLVVDPSSNWRRTAKGWRYDDAAGVANGVRQVRLTSGDAGNSAIRMRARGEAIPMPPAANGSALLAHEPYVILQLVAVHAGSAGSCWSSAFTVESVRRESAAAFLATGQAGAVPKRAFVTSECYDGGLGGLGGADATCQSLADAHMLGAAFKAWLATAGEGPATRFVHGDARYVLLDGTVVAADWKDLADGAISAPIDLDEALSLTDGASGCGSEVWTNVSSDGSSAIGDGYEFVCQDWTVPLYARSGLTGSAAAVDASWTDGGAFAMQPCSQLARLYCFEQ